MTKVVINTGVGSARNGLKMTKVIIQARQYSSTEVSEILPSC